MAINFSLLEKEMDSFIMSSDVMAVLLVGSSAVSKSLDQVHDIDFFVIQRDGENLEREIIERDNLVWDITYLPLALLGQGIREKWAFLIHSLREYKPIVIKDNSVTILLREIQNIYEKGPGVLGDEDVNYLRFKLTQSYEDLLKRKEDYLNAKFLAANLLKDLLIAYFRLNNQWVPVDKKLLSQVRLKDKSLYHLCVNLLEADNLEMSLSILENMIEYVLNSFGGKLNFWKKGNFPLI